MKRKELLERALKTFVEAVGAVLVANLTQLTKGVDTWEAWRLVAMPVFIGALATGISVTWNAVIDPWLKTDTTKDIDKIDEME